MKIGEKMKIDHLTKDENLCTGQKTIHGMDSCYVKTFVRHQKGLYWIEGYKGMALRGRFLFKNKCKSKYK